MVKKPLKALGDLNQLRKQAKRMQSELAAEVITIEDGDITVKITGSQELIDLSIKGLKNQDVIDVLNRAIKKSQEAAAKKLQEMTGGLGDLMGNSTDSELIGKDKSDGIS
jgi:DNA-binding protein YbaB